MDFPVALQMFSLREMWEANPLAAMRAAKEAGYQGIEFYGQHYGADLYAALLEECGLVCCGWHVNYMDLDERFDEMVARNRAVNNHLMVVPWFKGEKAADWHKFAEWLNDMAEKCAPLGMRIGYHNHAHEFQPVDGERPWDIIANETIPQVCLQMDVGHVMNSGADPVAELPKHPYRSPSIHCKPWSQAAKFETPIGKDDVDWVKCLDFCRKQGGTEWLIVEYTPKDDPVTAVTESLTALRGLMRG